MNIKINHQKKHFFNKSNGIILNVFFGVTLILLIVHSILLIYPFVWLINNSLKTNFEYITTNSMSLPTNYQWQHYRDVFTAFTVKNVSYLEMTFNSVWFSVLTTVIATFMSCVVAYTVSKYDFKLKGFVYGLIMFTMMFPVYGSGAAAYKQLFTLNLYDSPLILIKSAGGYGGFQFLMLYSFFVSLPKDYMEAAEIDGAGQFRTFLTIMLPMAIGPIVAIAVTTFIGAWNNYMTAIVEMPSYPGLATGVYLYEKAMANGMNYPMFYTGTILATIPVFIIFICFSDAFLSNMSIGGLKG